MSTHSAGDRVAHAQYGERTVSSVNQYHTVIEFDAHGARPSVSPSRRADTLHNTGAGEACAAESRCAKKKE